MTNIQLSKALAVRGNYRRKTLEEEEDDDEEVETGKEENTDKMG